MIRLLKYRLPLIVLTLVFALLNVGLPVVLDACPMEKALGAGACAMCHPALIPGREEIRLPAGSCCVPTTIVEKSTTEFEQAVPALHQELRQQVFVHPDLNTAAEAQFVDFPVHVSPSWSPPLQVDIPILTSSLLI